MRLVRLLLYVLAALAGITETLYSAPPGAHPVVHGLQVY
jgi:hypothetical protein